MSEELSPEEVEILKARFRATGCTITDIGDTNFEIVGWDTFPLRTHVSANPYYIQLVTFITAKGQGFLPNRLGKVHAFLNRANLKAKLAKFTLEADKPDSQVGGWWIMASFKFVTGVAGGSYDGNALKNLVTLWFQDIAELILEHRGFGIHTMLQNPQPNDDKTNS